MPGRCKGCPTKGRRGEKGEEQKASSGAKWGEARQDVSRRQLIRMVGHFGEGYMRKAGEGLGRGGEWVGDGASAFRFGATTLKFLWSHQRGRVNKEAGGQEGGEGRKWGGGRERPELPLCGCYYCT